MRGTAFLRECLCLIWRRVSRTPVAGRNTKVAEARIAYSDETTTDSTANPATRSGEIPPVAAMGVSAMIAWPVRCMAPRYSHALPAASRLVFFWKYVRAHGALGRGHWRTGWYCRYSNRLDRLQRRQSPWQDG